MTIAVINTTTLQVVSRNGREMRWGRMPKELPLPNGDVVAPPYLGLEHSGRRLVEIVEQGGDSPGEFYRRNGEDRSLAGNTLTITYLWQEWTQAEKDAEIARRAEAETDSIVSDRLGKVLYELAKVSRPTLTPAQFRAWVRSL